MKTLKQTFTGAGFLTTVFMLMFNIPFAINAQSGWFPQASGTNSNLNSVHFENPATGWAAGANCILKTTDGGSHWVDQMFPWPNYEDYYFNCICFSSTQNGCLVGEHMYMQNCYMVIYRTTNGGVNWNRQYSDKDNGLKSVCFPAPVNGWTVGSNVILSTSNSGSSWYPQSYIGGLNDNFTYNSVCFMNSLTGWILADVYVVPPGANFNAVIKTTNGGQNWNQVCRLPDKQLKSIHFQGQNTGWAVGGGTIMATADGGSHWTMQLHLGTENCDYSLESVHFINLSTGWVTGGINCSPFGGYSRVVLKTNNGGLNWVEQTFGAGSGNFHLNSVFFTNELTGWSVGDGGMILKTTDGGVTGIEPVNNETPVQYKLYQNYPNPFNPLTKIYFSIPPVGAQYTEPVQLRIYDILGRDVAVLVNEKLSPGTYEVDFDGTNHPSGVYFYKLTASDFIDTKIMIMVK